MALRPIDRTEIGTRVQTVREMANLSARQLRIALGSADSNLVADIEEGKKKIVDLIRLGHIAEICEGKGQLADVEADEILNYLIGRIDWDTRPRLRAVEETPARVSPKRAKRASSSQISYLRCIRAPKLASGKGSANAA